VPDDGGAAVRCPPWSVVTSAPTRWCSSPAFELRSSRGPTSRRWCTRCLSSRSEQSGSRQDVDLTTSRVTVTGRGGPRGGAGDRERAQRHWAIRGPSSVTARSCGPPGVGPGRRRVGVQDTVVPRLLEPDGVHLLTVGGVRDRTGGRALPCPGQVQVAGTRPAAGGGRPPARGPRRRRRRPAALTGGPVKPHRGPGTTDAAPGDDRAEVGGPTLRAGPAAAGRRWARRSRLPANPRRQAPRGRGVGDDDVRGLPAPAGGDGSTRLVPTAPEHARPVRAGRVAKLSATAARPAAGRLERTLPSAAARSPRGRCAALAGATVMPRVPTTSTGPSAVLLDVDDAGPGPGWPPQRRGWSGSARPRRTPA